MQEVPDLYMFFGRFHPLFVHLPIGILVFALIFQIYLKWKPNDALHAVLPIVWGLAALSAVLSALSGYILSLGGGYSEEILSLHKIGGITLSILSICCFILSFYRMPWLASYRNITQKIVLSSIAVILLLTGHWGGTLTHGNDYLMEFSPFVVTDSSSTVEHVSRISSLDSADIFKDAVQPIFQSKCVSCHNVEKKKGGLLLTSYEEMLAGGKTKAGIIPGNTATSEIFRRITLPTNHKEFMPADGKKPLTENQVAILEWWIDQGAQRNMMISSMKPNKHIQDLFSDFFQLGRDAILSYVAKPASSEALSNLLKAGFQVHAISESNNLLEVKYTGPSTEKLNLSLLESIREQLVWLQLINCGVTDEDLKIIGGLSNLYKLNLNRNKLTAGGLNELIRLPKVEYLNLYGTSVTDSSINQLVTLPKLKKLYVWESRVDSLGVESAKRLNQRVDIVYRLN
jgi:uncharacterized membrane protein